MSVILRKRWVFMGISIALMVISILSICFRGFNLDTDFAGGIAVTYKIDASFDADEVEAIANEALGSTQSPSSVQVSNGNEVVIKFGYDNALTTDEERSDFALEKVNAISTALLKKYDPENADKSLTAAPEKTEAAATEEAVATEEAAAENNGEQAEAVADTETPAEAEEVADYKVTLKNQDIISPSTGNELARSALWMSILACLAILVYVTFRFEFVSGVVAVICLVHDVLLLLGLYSIMQWSVNINFIAAILTVLGYSINNTIVIMDRIRENTRHARKESYSEIADTIVRQTMLRSVNTTITTLLTIGMVWLLGVTSIKAFALPIIIGILVGFYSSVFDAGSIWATWKDSAVKGKKK